MQKEIQKQIKKSSMRNGLILGVIFSIRFFLSTQQSTILSGISFALAMIILYATYYFSISLRDKELGGSISYGKAFKFILLTFFYAALISAVTKYIYFQVINPGYLEEMYNQTMLMLESIKLPANEESEAMLASVLRPAPFAILSIWSNMLAGLIGALILAAIVKKEKNIFE